MAGSAYDNCNSIFNAEKAIKITKENRLSFYYFPVLGNRLDFEPIKPLFKIKEDISNGKIIPFYQPIIDNTNSLVFLSMSL